MEIAIINNNNNNRVVCFRGGTPFVRVGVLVVVVFFVVLPLFDIPGVGALVVEDKTVSPKHLWGGGGASLGDGSVAVMGGDTGSTTGSSGTVVFEKFAFDEGGRITIAGKVNSNDVEVFLYICDRTEYQSKFRNGNWINWLCSAPEHSIGDKISLNGQTTIYEVLKKDLYYFSLVDCSESNNWEAHLSYTLYSNYHQRQQLSYDQRMLPTFYASALGAWLLLTLVWTVVLVFSRNDPVAGGGGTPIERVLWVVLLLKLVFLSVQCAYWWVYSLSGIRYEILSYLLNFLFVFPEIAFFWTLFLLSKGWRITRAGVPAAEIRSTFVVLLVLLSTLLFFSFYNTEYYWISLVLMYIFILPKIFTSLSSNLQMLETHLTTLQRYHYYHYRSQQRISSRSSSPVVDPTPLVKVLESKCCLFWCIRIGLVLYLLSIISVNVIAHVLLSWEYSWVPQVLTEAVLFFICMFVYYYVRVKRKNLFYMTLAHYRSTETLVNFFQNSVEEEEDEEEAMLDEEQDEEGGGNSRRRGVSRGGGSREEYWDLTKMIAIEWPMKKSEGEEDLTRMALALGYEEEDHQKLTTKKQKKQKL